MSSFVRSDFYIEPPAKDASVEDWNNWLKKDKLAATKAKREFTKKCQVGEMPQLMQDTVTRKVNGVWRQTTAIGITGSAEDGTVGLEPMVEAVQERTYDEARYVIRNRGVSHKKNGAEKRKARRLRRKMKRWGTL